MYSCSTLFSKDFRRYGHWKCENVNKIWQLPWWNRLGFLSSVGYIQCQQYIFLPHVNFICTFDLEVFNFSEKILWFFFYFALSTEFSTCQSFNLNRRWLDLFCNYYDIQCVGNHSTAFVVILRCCCNLLFWHIQNFVVNLDTICL
jgi:hypothetical protein